jgi:hypothetical protein
MTLSDTQRLVLSRAAQHEARLAAAPTGLPAAARSAVFRSLLKNGLLAECAAPREHAGRAVIARAGHRCEACGAGQGEPNPVTGSRVVLGAAHLDHWPENVDPGNLRAMCQRCHLRHDRPHHLTAIKANRLAAEPPGGLLALMLGAGGAPGPGG